MKAKSWLLLAALVATPALADNILSRAVDFGRELLDETRKLAPGIQQDHRTPPSRPAAAHPDDGRDAPALEPGYPPAGTTSTGPAVVAPSSPPPATPQSNQGWFVEEDHLK
ncbi:hypothetical protein GU3_06010 [Oceanimonas sp. GK1]|uniref:hypothetical protein n=1 Tax=Oceanimonas sp. (strain GK1 / IBRC-M 10197) TaxID=511062 RepID=UPI00024952AE|nr:hypothetical protein [Oceanimonas sp. GK1]AEY00958.1 hypothetical protein GU3_06010 [Oceanimonas sp. GK1]